MKKISQKIAAVSFQSFSMLIIGVLLVILSAFIVRSGTDNVNEEVSEEPVVCVCPRGVGVLYYGIKNPLDVAVAGVPSNRVTLSISHGDAQIGLDSSGYYIIPESVGLLTLAIKYTKGTKSRTYEKQFTIEQSHNYRLKLGNIDAHSPCNQYTSEDLAEQERLAVHYEISNPDYKVTGFNIIYAPKTGNAVVTKVIGDTIPATFRAKLKSAIPGDHVLIDHIRIGGPDGEKPLNPVLFDIK